MGEPELWANLRALERRVEHLYRELGVETPSEASFARDKVSPEVRDLIGKGHRIRAVHLHRKQTGVGLEEASETVDALAH